MSKLIKKEEPTILYSSDGSHKKKKIQQYDEVIPENITLEIRRVKNKRAGKFVIIIINPPEDPDYCKKLLKNLKKTCACGGTYKKSQIEIQGDKFDQVNSCLIGLGFKTKKIGG